MASVKKILALVFISLALVCLLGFWAWQMVSDFSPAELSDINVSADLSLDGVELSHGKNGTVAWTLQALSARYLEEQSTIDLTQPVITYFQEGGEPVVVSAPRGRVDRKEDFAFLDPEVEVHLKDSVIKAREMTYRGKQDEIFLKGDVHLIRADLTMRADQATVNLEGETIAARGNIQARIRSAPTDGGNS